MLRTLSGISSGTIQATNMDVGNFTVSENFTTGQIDSTGNIGTNGQIACINDILLSTPNG